MDPQRPLRVIYRTVMKWLLLACLFACSKNDQPPPPTSGAPNAKQESGPGGHRGGGINDQAQKMFASVCATCHGMDGTGNGPAAATLNPKPRNYTDAAWQASVSDADLENIILQGGQAVGKSPMMPGQPQLKGQPEVLHGLVQIIRGFGNK